MKNDEESGLLSEGDSNNGRFEEILTYPSPWLLTNGPRYSKWILFAGFASLLTTIVAQYVSIFLNAFTLSYALMGLMLVSGLTLVIGMATMAIPSFHSTQTRYQFALKQELQNYLNLREYHKNNGKDISPLDRLDNLIKNNSEPTFNSKGGVEHEPRPTTFQLIGLAIHKLQKPKLKNNPYTLPEHDETILERASNNYFSGIYSHIK